MERYLMEILKVNHLKTHFVNRSGIVRAVDGVSFSVSQGETLGLVGESGAGKTVTALTLLGLARHVGARLVSGEVWYRSANLLAQPELYRKIRGCKISLIPQETGLALNPVLPIGWQLGEMYKVHLGLSAQARKTRILQLLAEVEIPNPALVARMYPHQLSGGLLQRVLLAVALSCGPEIIIADEPACSLDNTIQAQVLGLLSRMKAQKGLSMVLISHDLGVVANYSDRILVMRDGLIVESGSTAEILTKPEHPYTKSLILAYNSLGKGIIRGVAAGG